LVIEESPISHGLIQSLREQGKNVVDVKPDRDKRARLISQIDLFEGGSILLPQNAPWLEAFVPSCCLFRAVTTIRSTPLRRGSHGTVSSGSRRLFSERPGVCIRPGVGPYGCF
jgi:hypothetical protein